MPSQDSDDSYSWRSLLLPYTDEVLDDFTVAEPPALVREPESDSLRRGSRSLDVLDLARLKLLYDDSRDKPVGSYTVAAQSAVLDVRIMLPFEPSRDSVHRHEEELVASHMRLAYSVPRDRRYLRSGYSSEPILAEAAARQLYRWRNQSVSLRGMPPLASHDVAHRIREAWQHEPVVAMLKRILDENLLSLGEIDETVGRLLLTLARDDTTCTTYISRNPHFSSPVPLNDFIRRLFSEGVAETVLKSKPDNLAANAEGARTTFKEAFKDALVNFTHFTKWDDSAALTEDVALGCFIRSMAVICQHNAAAIDAFIPVLMDQTAVLDATVMTGILVRFKLRSSPGTMAAYTIDAAKVGLFPRSSCEGEASRRPYIALTMELGVGSKPPLFTTMPVKPASKQMTEAIPPPAGSTPNTGARHQQSSSSSKARSSEAAQRRRHPRYSIYAYGCSPTVYRVIGLREDEDYQCLLRGGKPLWAQPRQDPASLKPFFAVGDAAAASWDWLSNPPPDTVPRSESGGDGGVILLGALRRDDEVDNLAGGRDDLEDVHMELAE